MPNNYNYFAIFSKNGVFSHFCEFQIFSDNLHRKFLIMNNMDRNGSISPIGYRELIKKDLGFIEMSNPEKYGNFLRRF